MLRPYKYVDGEEIRDYKTLLEAKDGLFIVEEYKKYAVDQEVLLAKTEEDSMKRLNHLLERGTKVYARKKVYREPVFNKDLDEFLENWLFQFAYDYTENEYGQEELMEDKLVELKKNY